MPGNYFNRGIYDLHIIELKQIPLLEHTPADVMVRYSVRDVMATEARQAASGFRPTVTLGFIPTCSGHAHLVSISDFSIDLQVVALDSWEKARSRRLDTVLSRQMMLETGMV